MKNKLLVNIAVVTLAFLSVANAKSDCKSLPTHAELQTALSAVVGPGNTGLANDMWATIVDKDGKVCAVAFSGSDRTGQWLGSRVISAQKANTANLFSLPAGSKGIFSGLSLSTANLWAAVQPGGSLFGLQLSNPVNAAIAYGGAGNAGGTGKNYGQPNDPMVGHFIGGVNVFGGGLALYDESGNRVGGLGLSGDTSCADHIQAWKVRDALQLDHVPTGVSPTGDDNIIFDVVGGTSASGFGHPECFPGSGEAVVSNALPVDFPVGDNP